MYTLAADPQPWNGRGRWLAVLLVEPGHRDTIQMRHSMPQEVAKADSSYSYVRTDRFAPGPSGAADPPRHYATPVLERPSKCQSVDQ
jgi:hypothetical protein